MDHAQREQRLLQVLEDFTEELTTLKEAIALVHSANDQLPRFNLTFTLSDQATWG